MNLKAVSRNFDVINQPNGAAHKKEISFVLTSGDFVLVFMLRCIFSGHKGSVENAARMNGIVEARLTVIHGRDLE